MGFPKKPGHGFEKGTPEYRAAVAADTKEFRGRRRRAIEEKDHKTIAKLNKPGRPQALTHVERTGYPLMDTFMGVSVSRTYVSDTVLDDGVPFFGVSYFEGYHRGQINLEYGESTGFYERELDAFWQRFKPRILESSARIREARVAPFAKRHADRAQRVHDRKNAPKTPRVRSVRKRRDRSSST